MIGHAALFDEEFLRRLERLSIAARRARSGHPRGERRSPRRGAAVEFADFRACSPGDDLRRVDRNVYARFERLLLKMHEAEEENHVHILLDSSGSMDWGEPHKLTCAARTAAALGYLGLAGLHRVRATTLSAAEARHSPVLLGRRSLTRLLGFLAEGAAGGATDLNASLCAYAGRVRSPGPLFLISDLLSPGGGEAGLLALVAARYDIAVLHVLAPDELEPALTGNLRIVDHETGHEREGSLDERTLRAYQEHLVTWQATRMFQWSPANPSTI